MLAVRSNISRGNRSLRQKAQGNHNLEEQARELFKYWFINAPQESWKEKSLSDYLVLPQFS